MADNYWCGKNVFITGINGFIGGNLAKGLHEAGANIFGLLRNRTKNSFLFFEGLADKITLIEGDLCDKKLLQRIVVEQEIHCCFHLAAQVEVGLAMRYPFLTWETNIRGTYSLLEAFRENPETIESIVVASSDKAYGIYGREKMPYLEDYPLIPIFPYDVSKACADLIARSYATDLFRLPVIVTRFCNIYGPGQLNFSAVIPDAIRCALGYGRFIPRGNGSQLRDFIYTGDVVRLYMRIGETLSKDKKIAGEVFNAGTNRPKIIRDVVKEVFSVIGNTAGYAEVDKLWKGKETQGEIECQYMSFDKVNKHFGWTPQVEFKAGLRETARWFERYLRETRG